MTSIAGENLGDLRRVRHRFTRCIFPSSFLTIYDRLLNSRLGSQLPFRRRIVRAHMRSHKFPFYLRLGTTDWMVLDELFILCEYNRIRSIELGQVRRILDLGTNVGYSARLWHEFFPQATIVGVEPDQGNSRVCALNTRHFAQKFKFIQGLVGGAPGVTSLDRSRGDWGIRMVEKGRESCDAEKIEIMTISQILDRVNYLEGVDLVKCDIEGAEWEVFADCREWIPRVRHLLIELHGDRGPRFFQEMLRSNGATFDLSVWQSGKDSALVFLSRL